MDHNRTTEAGYHIWITEASGIMSVGVKVSPKRKFTSSETEPTVAGTSLGKLCSLTDDFSPMST